MTIYQAHIISKDNCVWCDRARDLLTDAGISFTEKKLATREDIEAFKRKGFTTVPQIYLNGALIGGHSDLVEYLSRSKF